MRDLVPPQDRDKKFGGKMMLVYSDFLQLLLVLEKANRAKIVNHTLKNSAVLWDENVVTL